MFARSFCFDNSGVQARAWASRMGQGSMDQGFHNVKCCKPEDDLKDKMVVGNSDVADVSGATFPTPLSRAALSSVIAQRRGSATLRISEKAAEMRAAGKDAWRINVFSISSHESSPNYQKRSKHIQLLCVSMCLHAYIYIHVYNVYKCTISFLCGCLEVSKLFERWHVTFLANIEGLKAIQVPPKRSRTWELNNWPSWPGNEWCLAKKFHLGPIYRQPPYHPDRSNSSA